MWFNKPKPELLTESDVIENAAAADKWAAIRLVGERLVQAGHVQPDYVDAMIEREKGFTTYIGNGLAIPHGIGSAKQFIRSSGLAIAQFPQGLDFGERSTAYLVIGIAGKGDEHLDLLAKIAEVCESTERVRELAGETDPARLIHAFL